MGLASPYDTVLDEVIDLELIILVVVEYMHVLYKNRPQFGCLFLAYMSQITVQIPFELDLTSDCVNICVHFLALFMGRISVTIVNGPEKHMEISLLPLQPLYP